MEPVTVTLTKPIKDSMNGREIAALVISREFEVGDLIAMEAGSSKPEKTLILIQRLYRTPEGAEVQIGDLYHLRPGDVKALDKAQGPFVAAGLGTGQPS